MLASPDMNKLIVPYLLEKLSSSQNHTRVESLNLLALIAQRFTLNELIDPSNGNQLLLQVLSQVSNLFFNVIVDEVQEKSATTIAHTLARLLESSNDLFGTSGGITFI